MNQTEDGDLLRVGYIRSDPDYRDIFAKEYERPLYFDRLSQLQNELKKCDVLTIGDSFSEQDNFGYQNYLAEKSNLYIVHFDRFFQLNKAGNPLQILYGIINGDLLGMIEPDYIILEAIEREIVTWGNNIDTTLIIPYNSFIRLTQAKSEKSVDANNYDGFLSDRLIKFPIMNILYFFDDNAYFSKVYRAETTQHLFSVEKKELLFTSEDLACIDINNDLDNVTNLNQALNGLSNRLKNKGIKLIVLLAPDKYDLYYSYFLSKSRYEEPLFFNHLEKMQKEYLYVESKKILSEAIHNSIKDIYYYDDTHWSPRASKIIAEELKGIIVVRD